MIFNDLEGKNQSYDRLIGAVVKPVKRYKQTDTDRQTDTQTDTQTDSPTSLNVLQKLHQPKKLLYNVVYRRGGGVAALLRFG